MNAEQIKVEARFLMLGCKKESAVISLFLLLLNAMKISVAAALIFDYRQLLSVQTAVFPAAAAIISLLLIFILHSGADLIFNRWFFSAIDGNRESLSELLQNLSFRELCFACRLRAEFLARTLFRFAVALSVPAFMLAATLALVSRGISVYAFRVLVLGTVICLAAALYFGFVFSRGVNAAYLLCRSKETKKKSSLRHLDENCFEIAIFTFSLSLSNPGYRRQAKQLYSHSLINQAEHSAFRLYRRKIHA